MSPNLLPSRLTDEGTWNGLVEIEGEWMILPDMHGNISLLEEKKSILDGAIEIRMITTGSILTMIRYTC